jgi:hypothetical protein
MEKLSFTQVISLCLITINSLSTNIFINLNKIRQDKLIMFFKSLEVDLRRNGRSQMTDILDKGMVKVAICENVAYWVVDNEIYRAEVDKDGRVDSEKASVVDVFNLSEKEVEKLLVIIDSIKE